MFLYLQVADWLHYLHCHPESRLVIHYEKTSTRTTRNDEKSLL